MDDDTDLESLFVTLDEGAVQKRREAAETIAEVASDKPDELADVTRALALGLRDEDEVVRRSLSSALFQVGVSQPEAVKPVVRRLFSYLDDSEPAVRANVARPIAEVAAVDPGSVRVAVETLLGRLDDADERVRRSVAWAVETVAFRYPDDVITYRDRVQSLVKDSHEPAAAHGCRTVAQLQRRSSTGEGEVVETLIDRLHADSDTLRAAACTALGAIGSDRARTALGTVLEHPETPPAVGIAARHGLREATYPLVADTDQPSLTPPYSETVPETGEWLSLGALGFTPRTGRYRGVVTSTEPRSMLDVSTAIESETATLELTNPYEGYALALELGERTVTAQYEDRQRGERLQFESSDLKRIDTDRVPLLYATEGDTLSFRIEQTTYETDVVNVTRDDEHVVVCAEQNRGHEIEFRPLRRKPTVARFRKGRGFEARELSLSSPESARSEGTGWSRE